MKCTKEARKNGKNGKSKRQKKKKEEMKKSDTLAWKTKDASKNGWRRANRVETRALIRMLGNFKRCEKKINLGSLPSIMT